MTMRGLVIVLGAVTSGLFLFVVWSRFRWPVDGEWLVGAMRDGVERVRDGRPLYPPPDEAFIPFVYPPFYYWAAALVARFTSVFVACKLVSLASTVIAGACIVRFGRLLGVSGFWRAASVLLFVGSYSTTLLVFDLERVDIFATMIVMVGLAGAMNAGSTWRTAMSGALLGAAFFAKQPHVLAFGAVVVALFVSGERRRAWVTLAAGSIVFVALFAYLEQTTHGWFRFYCVKIPGAHGIDSKVVSSFFIADLPTLLLPGAASIALGFSLSRFRKSPKELVFAAVVVATMAEAFFLRAHRGGWSNVIVAWTPLGCAAAGVVASRLETQGRAVTVAVLAGAAFELLGSVFDPGDSSPNQADLEERTRLVALVRKLEKQGPVLVSTQGNISEPRHFHMAALYDILRAGEPLPHGVEAAWKNRVYAAVLVREPLELQCDSVRCDEAFLALASNYFVAARREEREHNPMAGFDARPRWILRPRTKPLAGVSLVDMRKLTDREAGLALAAWRVRAPEAEALPDDGIEDAASR